MSSPSALLSPIVLAMALAGMLLTPTLCTADSQADSVSSAEQALARAALARVAPQLEPEAVRPTPMAGLLEVEAGGQVFYLSRDGRHLLHGSLIDTVERVDLTEARRRQQRVEALQGLTEAQVVRFEAAEPRHRVTVFTALECGYCRRFHNDIEAYLQAGISVDYVLIPMRGEGSDADLTGARLFCAADRQDAFTRATAGQTIEGPMCESGYAEGKALAARLGIRNTPTVVFADGSQSGYLDAGELAQRLQQLAAR
jgi:thiol:disulfide interchange protein DsbC